MRRNANPRRNGFTLVEMLVVIGIIIVLASMLLPAMMRARRASRQAACAGNLREIGHMLLMYAGDNNDCSPVGITAVPEIPPWPPDIKWIALPEWTCYLAIAGQPCGNLGPLLANDMISGANAKILYCPTDGDEKLTYNIWQANFPARKQALAPDRLIRISYFGRPIYKFYCTIPGIATVWPRLPARLTDLQGKALFADRPVMPFSHGTESSPRVNVLYFDGAVRSVTVPQTTNTYFTPDAMPPYPWTYKSMDVGDQSGVEPALEGWSYLDRQ